jgi:hypothetical protein
MRKAIAIILLLLVTLVTLMRFGGDKASGLPLTDARPSPIKAVHYFSSNWPKSFWEDFEKSRVEDEFDQIKADGFNTVILVVSWLGFETGFEDGVPQPSVLYDRLEWLLAKLEQAGLDYGLRISFPHNFDPANGIRNNKLCTDIFVDKQIRENWVKYVSRVAEGIDKHRDSFKFAFFSWEDFFCPYASIPTLNEAQRLEMARRSGYQSWLAGQFPMSLLELVYKQSFDSIEEVPFPARKSPAYILFLQFVDQFLVNELLIPAREVLPELAMEVRVDKDRIHDGDVITWAEHDLALSDEQMRGSYWGAYFGANNEGETLTADEALRNFEYMLDQVSDQGKNTNHIVEQFNFADNTPGYVEKNAKIETDELPAFLEGAAKLLKKKSRGYGLWAYRDYVDSAIYNSSFELGLRGWDSEGELVVFSNADGDQALRMQAGTVISQTFVPFDRFAGLGPSEVLTFCANVTRLADPANITLKLNGAFLAVLEVNKTAQHCLAMDAQSIKKSEVTFSISSDVEIEMDDLRLYSYVQILGVYDKDGLPGPLRDLIFRLNTQWLAE